MGFEKGILKALGLAAAVSAGASAEAATRPQKPDPERPGVQRVGFEVKMVDDRIETLYTAAEKLLREFRRERENLNDNEVRAFEGRLFEAAREYGKALREFKKEKGFPYPGLYTQENWKAFEEQATRGDINDTRKQELLEEFIADVRSRHEAPTDTDATIRGQYCGEFPDLCPPTN